MGEFQAGYWIIGLLLYFFVFLIIVTGIVEASKEFPDMQSSGVYQNRLQFDSENAYIQGAVLANVTGADADTVKSSSFVDALQFASGIGSGEVGIGMPVHWQFLFSFIFFYIPAIMLLFSIYMILPFAH